MELKFISFNIRGDDDPNGHSIAERAPRLKTFIDECDPDIMGFQEYLPKWEAYIEMDYTHDFEFFVKGRGETGGKQHDKTNGRQQQCQQQKGQIHRFPDRTGTFTLHIAAALLRLLLFEKIDFAFHMSPPSSIIFYDAQIM